DELLNKEHADYEDAEFSREIDEHIKSTSQLGAHESRPLKAPKAVLKMLRFPDEYNREIASESDVLDKSNVEETAPETEDSLEDIYPTLTEAEQITEPSMKEHAAPESDDAESANFRLQRSDENEMERLHRDFVRQMRAIVAENAEFGVHLGLEIDALDDATKIQNVEDRRKAILASMKKLSESHTQLAKKFDTAQTYLSIIESDKQKLSDELDRARMLSLTDELTSLPNRRAFMRRMDDEVSRVKRYGFPLSLVLIDIDHFKQVNDKYGHAAGDKVLRIYSEKILSIFRHHDMIARYGGEEFAVLLPNTDLDGVLRALDKVKSTVPKVQCKIGGMTINAPTFSAGVTEYRAPETPTQFIERADHALYRAKRLGRNRIEVEQKDNEHDVLDQT
ncbi:GGDEF domain-containing protein, partial [Kaarinaea lacus]